MHGQAKIAVHRMAFIALIGALFCINQASAQVEFVEEDFEELFVYLSVENLGLYQIDAIYAQEEIHLPLLGLFSILRIYTSHSAELDTLSGFIGNEGSTFQIYVTEGKANFQGKEVAFDPSEVYATFGDVFLSARVYRELFALKLDLDFRALTVRLTSEVELPVVRMLRIEKMRDNLRIVKGEAQVDTTVRRKFSAANGLIVDWSLRTKQATNEVALYNLRTVLGAELLGGEFNLRSNFTTDAPIRLRDQAFNWRLVNNESPIVKQVNVGYIGVPLNSQTTTPLFGAGISNTPTTFRKSYGSFVLQKQTQPGWDVELFVNNVLVDFATADANGEVRFEVPLVYGNSIIQIRFYGPWGEEEVEEQVMNIPFVFVPHRQVEYQVFSGITSDSAQHRFNTGRVAYGLNRRATLTFGYEQFERNITSRSMPFAMASVALFDNALVSFTSVVNAFHKASFLVRTNKSLFIEGSLRRFEEGQDAELINLRQEAMLGVNASFALGKRRLNFRAAYRTNQFEERSIHFIESNLSGFIGRMNIGLTNSALFSRTRSINTGLNMSAYLPRQWMLQGQVFADMYAGELRAIRVQAQKRLNKGAIAGFNANYAAGSGVAFGLNLFFDLRSMTSAADARFEGRNFSSSQSVNGSTLFSRTGKRVQTNSRSSIGRGIVDVMVFLDVNHNGKRDLDEVLLNQVSVSMNRGIHTLQENDSVHRFIALEPYTQHIITLSDAGLPNIAWFMPLKSIGVVPDPNSVKAVYVPVQPMGEVEGQIVITSPEGKKALARMAVYITGTDRVFNKKLITDELGYFNFLGLTPGCYTLSLDQEQLHKLGYDASTPVREVIIRMDPQGDFQNELNFELTPRATGLDDSE